MALYKELGINPFASCLPMVIQFPIIIGLYQAIIQSMANTPHGSAATGPPCVSGLFGCSRR